MSEHDDGAVAYRSRVEIVRHGGPVRTARLPAEEREIVFGVHSEVAAHYGLDDSDAFEPRATTIDYVVAATGG